MEKHGLNSGTPAGTQVAAYANEESFTSSRAQGLAAVTKQRDEARKALADAERQLALADPNTDQSGPLTRVKQERDELASEVRLLVIRQHLDNLWRRNSQRHYQERS